MSIGETFIIILLILLNECWRNKVFFTKYAYNTWLVIKVTQTLWERILKLNCYKVIFYNIFASRCFLQIFTVNVYHNVKLLCWVKTLVFFLFFFACPFFAWHFLFLSFTKEVGKQVTIPAGIYLLKVSNRNTKTRCEICSKLIRKTSEQCQWSCSCVFIINYDHISHLFLMFLLLTLKM